MSVFSRYFFVFIFGWIFLTGQAALAEELIGGSYTINSPSVNVVSGTLQGGAYVLQTDMRTLSGNLSGGAYSINTGFETPSAVTITVPPVISSGGGGGGGGGGSGGGASLIQVDPIVSASTSPAITGTFNQRYPFTDFAVIVGGRAYSARVSEVGRWRIEPGVVSGLSAGVYPVVVDARYNGRFYRGEGKITITGLSSSCQSMNSLRLKRNSQGEKVAQLQQNLKQWGYFSGAADGFYKNSTVQAVTKFQKDYKIRTTIFSRGTIGSKTAAKLAQVCTQKNKPVVDVVAKNLVCLNIPTLKKGSKSNHVRTLQKELKDMGHFSAEVDGYYGASTVDAVAAFQQVHKIIVNKGSRGVFGPSTRNVFNKASCKQMVLPQIKTATINTCTPFTRSLMFGSYGEDVVRLQEFLLKELKDKEFTVTGTYGFETVFLVSKFQQKYFEDIVAPSGAIKPTGWFGSFSIKKANEILGCTNR